MMNTKTMRKAARDLVPGDVLVMDDRYAVIKYIGDSEALFYTRLSGCSAMVKEMYYAPDVLFTVELPAGLTPVQQAADKLLGYAKQFLYEMPPMETEYSRELRALLDELEPPKPPTLEEAIALLRSMRGVLVKDSADAVNKFLARVPD